MTPRKKLSSLLSCLVLCALALVSGGCGNGGLAQPPANTGSVEGAVYVPAGNPGAVGRSALGVNAPPAGYTPLTGATVTISGSTVLTTTTDQNGYFIIRPVPKGDQIVVINKTGYDTITTTVSVKNGQVATVGGAAGIKTFPSQSGTLVVLAQAPGGLQLAADVTLNGVITGLKTPYSMQGIMAGQHQISVSLAGYDNPGPRLVTLSEDATLTTTFTLTPLANLVPQVSILTPVNNQTLTVSSSILLTGSGVDPEDGVLSGSALAWSSSLQGALGTGAALSVNNLQLGAHTITLTGVDSGGLSATVSAVLNVTVPANSAPAAAITTPGNGQNFTLGSPVTLTGTGADVEDGLLSGSSLVWVSSLNGTLGTGSPLIVTNLTTGTHTLTLSATDKNGLSAQDTRTITVSAPQNQAPSAAMVTPLNNQQVAVGSSIAFTGAATDPEEGILSGSRLVWSSSLNGVIGTGNSFSRNDLTLGTHTITLTATDAQGLSGSVSRTISVGQSSNTAPIPVIATPQDGSTANSGSAVTFTGTATDTEDGVLTGDRLVWSSNRQGTLGTGTALTVNNLAVGEHTITLTAVDSGNLTGTDTMTLTVVIPVNTPPTATIVTPVSNQEVAVGATVVFSGLATDPQEGQLDPSAMSWTSSLDGALGTGNNLIKTNLSAGSHTITLTVTDSGGLTASTTRTLVVSNNPNNGPVATILLPLEGQTVAVGATVNLVGTGVDAEDGALGGASVVWSSSIQGALGSGANLAVGNLTAGTHIITLTVTDSGGRTGTATRTLVVSGAAGGNQAPTATITTPQNNQQVAFGTAVLLSGNGADPEDGVLGGQSLAWSSNLNGALGTGAALVVATLLPGTHTITLTATDSGGNTGVATRTLVVTAAP